MQIMARDVNSDEFVTLLLKCVGSKYPIIIKFRDNRERPFFITGFSDASCTTLNAMSSGKEVTEVSIADIKGFVSRQSLTLGTVRGTSFQVVDS